MSMDFGTVFVAVDNNQAFLCPRCAEEEKIDLGSQDAQTWEVGSGGWLGPIICKKCNISIPVVVNGAGSIKDFLFSEMRSLEETHLNQSMYWLRSEMKNVERELKRGEDASDALLRLAHQASNAAVHARALKAVKTGEEIMKRKNYGQEEDHGRPAATQRRRVGQRRT